MKYYGDNFIMWKMTITFQLAKKRLFLCEERRAKSPNVVVSFESIVVVLSEELLYFQVSERRATVWSWVLLSLLIFVKGTAKATPTPIVSKVMRIFHFTAHIRHSYHSFTHIIYLLISIVLQHYNIFGCHMFNVAVSVPFYLRIMNSFYRIYNCFVG